MAHLPVMLLTIIGVRIVTGEKMAARTSIANDFLGCLNRNLMVPADGQT
jgi:hypothetical protein